VRSRGEPELIEKTFGEARPISLGHCGDRVQIGSRLFADRPGVCVAVLRRQLAAFVHARRAASVAAEP
jgi:hypothetical protein